MISEPALQFDCVVPAADGFLALSPLHIDAPPPTLQKGSIRYSSLTTIYIYIRMLDLMSANELPLFSNNFPKGVVASRPGFRIVSTKNGVFVE